MSRRSPLILAFGALLGTSAILAPLAVSADPAAATVPDASGIKPAAPASAAVPTAATPGAATGTAKGAASTNDASSSSDATKSKGASSASDMEAKRRAQREADREAYFSAHLAALHAGLSLQADQQSLWQPVESAIRDLAKARAERWRMHHGDDQGMASQDASSGKNASDAEQSDSVDRLLARGENMTHMGNAIQSLAKATSPLLASLSPEQKDRLPTLVEGLKPRRLIAQAFNLGDETNGGNRQGFGNERGQGFGMRFQQDGRHDFMQGGADQDGPHRYGMGDGSSPQGRYGQYGTMGNQQRFMPGDTGEDE